MLTISGDNGESARLCKTGDRVMVYEPNVLGTLYKRPYRRLRQAVILLAATTPENIEDANECAGGTGS